MNPFIDPRPSKLNVFLFAVCLITLFIGCQSSPFPNKDPYAELQPVPVPRVTLGPGDDIEIQFTYAPQFNSSRTVQRDGKVQLPLLGSEGIMVQGKTPSELQNELIKQYSDQLKHPELTVIARSLYQDRVYVGGQVKEPGLLEVQGQITALQAIMRAGGFDMKTAKVNNVVVIRHKDGKRYGCALDYTDALKGKEAEPFYLEPFDVVWVPRSTITKVNQWIDQYINRIVPQTGFIYTHIGKSHTIGMHTTVR